MDILIGANYIWDFCRDNVIRGDSGPVAVETSLGFVLNGPVRNEGVTNNKFGTHVLKVACDHKVKNSFSDPSHVPMLPCVSDVDNESLDKFWVVESSGLVNEPESDNIVTKMIDQIYHTGERYETPLPWKPNHPYLPDNYAIAVKKLHSLINRLKVNPAVLDDYDQQIKALELDGIIEKIPTQNSSSLVHYIPHHPVFKKDKKLRIVHNCSFKTNGPSLNDCLITGPNLLAHLIDILISFRCYKIGIIADIKKAFLNVGISLEDRDALRFLWVSDIHSLNPEIIVRRFTRVIFGSTASQFLLNVVIRKHILQYHECDPTFVLKVLNELYVDDLISGEHDDVSALKYYEKCKSRFLEAGLELSKWNSNSDKCINDSDFTCKDNEVKVLGVLWDRSNDFLTVNLKQDYFNCDNQVPTKRNVLSVIAGLYDPIGIASPVVFLFKNLFQDICKMQKTWDTVLPNDLLERWLLLRESLNISLSVPRYYFSPHPLSSVTNINLHGFCDASQIGYAAVVYIVGCVDNKVIGNMVTCKTKVTPINRALTIPKLELTSCLFLSQLVHKLSTIISRVFSICNTFLWSDSLDSLHWIKEIDKRRTQFVTNKIEKIRKLTSIDSWRHIPGKMNPADLPSRGSTKVEEIRSWLSVPSFLKNPQEWPPDLSCKTFSDDGGNTVLTFNVLTSCDVDNRIIVEKNLNIGKIIDITRYSNLNKLYRITAYVLRFVQKIKLKDHEQRNFNQLNRGCAPHLVHRLYWYDFEIFFKK